MLSVLTVLNAYRFALRVYSPRIVLFRKIELAQFAIFKFSKLISHVLFYLFGVNCTFRFVSDYAVAASF